MQVTNLNNNIQTTGDSAINLTNNKATVKDNYLAGAKGVGNNAVVGAENATVSSNTPDYKVILASPRVYTEYADGVIYVVMAYDENGIPLENITLFSTVNNMTYNATTDDEGYAAFVVDLDAGYLKVMKNMVLRIFQLRLQQMLPLLLLKHLHL